MGKVVNYFIKGDDINAVITRTAHLDTVVVGAVRFVARSLSGYKTMDLWGTVDTNNGEKEIDMFSVPMHVNYLQIEAFSRRDNSTIWVSNNLIAPGSYEVKEAWNKVKPYFPLVPETIEVLLEAAGYPRSAKFDEKLNAIIANKARYLRLIPGQGYSKATVKGFAFDEVAITVE